MKDDPDQQQMVVPAITNMAGWPKPGLQTHLARQGRDAPCVEVSGG